MPQNDRVILAHGGGGRLAQRLLDETIFRNLGPEPRGMDDSAVLAAEPGPLAFTTDSFVVQPLVFPGGDIGRLAVCGTVNDLACAGAQPLYLSLGLIIEEGLETALLAQVCRSIAAAAKEAGARIVTGDTKVIERRGGGGLFINTAGIGRLLGENPPRLVRTVPGDAILINGPIADHGAAVMAARGEYGIAAPIQSDAAPLAGLAQCVLKAIPEVHTFKDPTRGGLAMSMHEIAQASQTTIMLDEGRIPVSPTTKAFCDLLGLDPLEVANEGKLIVACPAEHAEAALEAMRSHPLGRGAVQIGEARGGGPSVVMRTQMGGERLVGVPSGENLPRIC